MQLARLGFSFEEIRALSYDARDAIIVSNPEGRDDFLVQIDTSLDIKDFDAEAINNHVAETGALLFVLLNKDYRLEDIQPHQYSLYKELAW